MSHFGLRAEKGTVLTDLFRYSVTPRSDKDVKGLISHGRIQKPCAVFFPIYPRRHALSMEHRSRVIRVVISQRCATLIKFPDAIGRMIEARNYSLPGSFSSAPWGFAVRRAVRAPRTSPARAGRAGRGKGHLISYARRLEGLSVAFISMYVSFSAVGKYAHASHAQNSAVRIWRKLINLSKRASCNKRQPA